MTSASPHRTGSTGLPISLTDLRKSFGDADGPAAVGGITLDVPAGAFLVLLGPSGCGKTTTLRMLAGLEHPTGGEIRFGDRPVARGDRSVQVEPAERGVGMVFQSYALWPHKSVGGNVEWPLRVAGWPREERRRRVQEVLALLSIEELAERYPGEISGGQQQRVANARTIASRPGVMLFDEPLSNLDATLRVDTRAELMRIHRATGATSVYVTHDQVEAMSMATHVALMREGRIEQFGTPAELLAAPATAFTATFVGTPPAAILSGEVRAGRLRIQGVDVGTADPSLEEGGVQLMYRSSGPVLADGPGAGRLRSVFVDQVPMAERWVIGLESAGGRRLSITQDVPAAHRPGDEVWVELPPQPAACFDTEGRRIEPERSVRQEPAAGRPDAPRREGRALLQGDPR